MTYRGLQRVTENDVIWERGTDGVIRRWDPAANTWIWWDPNAPGPRPPEVLLQQVMPGSPVRSGRRWPIWLGVGIALVVVLSIMAGLDPDPPSLQGSDEPRCGRAVAGYVSGFSTSFRKGVPPAREMFYVESDLSFFAPWDEPDRDWFVAADIDGIGVAVWATGLDPEGGDGKGLTAPINAGARRASGIGTDISEAQIPSMTDLDARKVARCAREAGS